MAKAAKTLKIDSKTYTIQPLDADEGLDLLLELGSIIGEPAIRLALSVKNSLSEKKSLMDVELSADDGAKAIAGLFSRLERGERVQLFKRILATTLADGGSNSVNQDFGVRFMGDYMHLFKVVWATLEVNYGDFLGALAGFGRTLAPQIPPQGPQST